jgi:hypothetical protein
MGSRVWLLKAGIISIDWSLAGFMIPELHGLALGGRMTCEMGLIGCLVTMMIAWGLIQRGNENTENRAFIALIGR